MTHDPENPGNFFIGCFWDFIISCIMWGAIIGAIILFG